MRVVPHLGQCLALASKVWSGTAGLLQGALDIAQLVSRRVGRSDPGVGKPFEGGVLLVSFCHGIEEVDNILVLLVVGVTFGVKGGEASSVLGEFMSPEARIGRSLRDPILLHVGQKVAPTKVGHESVDGWTGILGNRLSIDGSRTWFRIVYTTKVAVRVETTVAIVWPKTVDGPIVLWKVLTLLLKACMGIPELSLKYESTWSW